MTFSDNASEVTWFTLSGFGVIMEHRVTIFSLSLLCYSLIIIVNVALILTIIFDENLHEPMYIFLCNLCISGLVETAGFYPKFLLDLLSTQQVISFAGCITQIFIIYCSACADVVILAVMAYDRYVAICRPLEYYSVMTKKRITQLVFYPWVSIFCLFSIAGIISGQLRLCGSHIDKLYCANWSIVKLSCSSNTTANNVMGYVIILFYVAHIIFILCSYAFLTRLCLKSIEDRGKFMQTCIPHLLSVINVAVALLFDVMYTRYGSTDISQNILNFMAIHLLIFPPILNPLIYGFQLRQIQNRIQHFFLKSERKKIFLK